jgi:hypothetical protein
MINELLYQNYVNRCRALGEEYTLILTSHDYVEVENKLHVKFSKSFKKINNICSYENLFIKDFFSFSKFGGVIAETLRLRNDVNLPNDVLFLYEDDASIILMQVGTTEPQEEKVFWIAVEDYDRFCKGETLEYKHHIFLSFTDFFEYLLTEEEKERGLISKGT